MGRLIDGIWRTRENVSGQGGRFQRQETQFRDFVAADPGARFQPEPGRYHLYVSLACPWAHRTLIVRALRGLQDAIGVSVVHPEMADNGWELRDGSGSTPDPIHGADYLYQVYAAARADYTGRVSVPVLWDRQEGTIVNNESREIIRMFDTAFANFGNTDVNLLPAGLERQVDAAIDAIFSPINNGVYMCGFAGTQAAYDEAVQALFAALEHWESVLAEQRYVCGSVLTEADICLFTTLFRFDPVYVTHFKCNLKRLMDYPNLYGFVREIYQLPGVAQTCNLDHIKRHYYWSHESINPRRIVAMGFPVDYETPHGRGF